MSGSNTGPYEPCFIPLYTDEEIEAAVKKAGERQHTSDNGVVRSDPTGKTDYTLISYEMLTRYAEHMTKAVAVKGHNNWRNAGPEDAERFQQGAWRHFVAWLNGEQDEDHAAALYFNIAGYEHACTKWEGDDDD